MSLSIALAFLLATGARGQAAPDREYRIKAVFLYHFTQFVDWPDSAFADSTAPVVVGVLGSDPFGSYLEEVVKGEKVKNRPIVVQRYKRPEDAVGAQVLFLSGSEFPRAEAVLAVLKGKPILTVGETDGFCRLGGAVCFLSKAGKIRFEINLDAAKAGNLNVSSKLLRLADVAPRGKG